MINKDKISYLAYYATTKERLFIDPKVCVNVKYIFNKPNRNITIVHGVDN